MLAKKFHGGARRLALFLVALVVTIGAAEASAQVRVANGKGKTLKDLAGTEIYVTIWLNSGARDKNVRIRMLNDDHLLAVDVNDQSIAYNYSALREIRVQPDVVAVERRGIRRSGGLSSGGESIELLAIQRAFDLFEGNKDNGDLLMRAAAVMAATRGPMQQNAFTFLSSRSTVNDAATSVSASIALFVAGHETEPETVERGLYSGVRRTRGAAARLAGLTKAVEYEDSIVDMLRDPAAELYANAAIAVALMGKAMGLEQLLGGLTALNDEKAEAAVEALKVVGGDDIVKRLQDLVKNGRGLERFRAMRVLYARGDKDVIELMRPERLKEPALAVQSAILLCSDGDWDANIELRDELQKSKDPNRENLIERAKIAGGLYLGGHSPAKGTLQELLRLTPDGVYARGYETNDEYKKSAVIAAQVQACKTIAEVGARGLMTLLKPAVGSEYPEVAMAACEAAIAIGDPGFRERLLASRLE